MNLRHTTEEVIEKFNEVHKGRYGYDNFIYNGSHTKSLITCPIHGDFLMTPNQHLSGKGCSKCANNTKLTNDEFKNRLISVFGDKYSLYDVDYQGCKTKIKLHCNEHGYFEATAYHLLQGHGCPKCKRSHIENDISRLLDENNIGYVEQKKFSWLCRQSLDFFLPEYNVAIECQGMQHFEPTKHFKNCEVLLKKR